MADDADSGTDKLVYVASEEEPRRAGNYAIGTFVENAQAFVDGMTKAEAAELRDAFDLFDKNGDQKISKDELGPVLRALGRNPTHEDLDSLMKEADTDNSGYLNFEEYARVIAKHMTPIEEVKKGLQQAFQVFDIDGSGHLDVTELQEVLCSVGDALTTKEAILVLRAVDANGDGKVDVHEFVEFLCNKV